MNSMNKSKIIYIAILFLIFFFAVFLRVYSYDKVFSEPIKYSADDGVYHMRLVENELLGDHFPHRLYFDPYTFFPYGTYVYFTPLHDQLLAGIIWVAGLGQPTLELINKIAPFYPAVFGSLIVFLIYFIGKSLWGRKAGLLSALLMGIAPAYLHKSLIGVTDHHFAEVLFSTLAMLFLILALISQRKTGLDRKFWLFVFLTGFSLGLYFLTWAGALLFLFIIFIFIISYYLIETFSGRICHWILTAGIIIFLITLVMISPFFGHPDILHSHLYNIQHLEALLFGILGFFFVGVLGELLKRKSLSFKKLLGFLFLGGILFLTVLNIAFPVFFEGLVKSVLATKVGVSSNPSVREIVSEMRPLEKAGIMGTFSCLFYFSLIGLGMIFKNFIKKRKSEDLLIIFWTLIIILMTGVVIPAFGLTRFTYYLAVNISLLSAFFVIKVLKFGLKGLAVSASIEKNSSIRKYVYLGSIVIIFNVIFFLFYPFPLNIFKPYPHNLPNIFQHTIAASKSGPHIKEKDWYDTLEWFKKNTPHPGVDYYALYQEPKFNNEKGEIEPFSYPEEAYGVLARWDMGHMITYYAHRMPVSNPFQQGLGMKEGEKVVPGEAVFFLETEEEKAIQCLDQLKVRYIITDYSTVDSDSYFKSLLIWLRQGNLEDYYLKDGENRKEGQESKYDNSMAVRLHLLDGRKLEKEEKTLYIKPLDHFRLIYESEKMVAFDKDDPKDRTQAVKIFEYVKGAKIIGKAAVGEKVTISTEIKTNQERTFIYQKSFTGKDGFFEFIVPYSTLGEEGIMKGETNFAVFASPYKLKLGNIEKEINISEKEILKGETIEFSI